MVRGATPKPRSNRSLRVTTYYCAEGHGLEFSGDGAARFTDGRCSSCLKLLCRITGRSAGPGASGLNEKDRRDFERSTGRRFKTSRDVDRYERETGLVVNGRIRADERRGSNLFSRYRGRGGGPSFVRFLRG